MSAGLHRTLYFFAGESLRIDGAELDRPAGVRVRPEVALEIEAGADRDRAADVAGPPIRAPS